LKKLLPLQPISSDISTPPERRHKTARLFGPAIRLSTLRSARCKTSLQAEEIYGGDHTNFAPRIGFAWDPKGDGKMAIRGGYSITYDANLGAVRVSRETFSDVCSDQPGPEFHCGLPAAQRPSGLFLNSPTFFNFTPTQSPLIVPNTLNVVNAPPMAWPPYWALFCSRPRRHREPA